MFCQIWCCFMLGSFNKTRHTPSNQLQTSTSNVWSFSHTHVQTSLQTDILQPSIRKGEGGDRNGWVQQEHYLFQSQSFSFNPCKQTEIGNIISSGVICKVTIAEIPISCATLEMLLFYNSIWNGKRCIFNLYSKTLIHNRHCLSGWF